jgi:hypothetical protein
MPRILKIVSALTSSLLASLPFVIAVELVVLLFWALTEITCMVAHDAHYAPLGFLFGLTLLAALGVTLWRCWHPRSFGLTTAATDSLNVLPLAVLDLAILLAAVFVSDLLQKPLTTPLLRFTQTMIHKITS